jgi:hypothetical protein
VTPQRLQQAQVAAQAMMGVEFPTTTRTLIGKAQPDECWDSGSAGSPPCAAPAVPKVNQGYAWSMVEAGGNIWFGTVANPLCAVLGSFLGVSSDVVTNSFACELSGGPLADLRPPQIWLHQPPSTLVNKTPVAPDPAFALVVTTAGMRAAGSHTASGAGAPVVLIGGPRLSPGGGINLFAYNAATLAFLGADTIGEAPALPPAADYTVYTDIRTFAVANGELYAGVKYEVRDDVTDQAVERGGKVLQWTGSLAAPFAFAEVATLETEVAYLAYHEGRLFASTWPVTDPASLEDFPANVVLAGVWMSPDFGGDGVLDGSEGAWTEIWKADDYEPDPVIAATYAGGAIASFDGALFWGTMHVPFVATAAHMQAYSDFYASLNGTTTPTLAEATLAAMVATQRTGKVFRGENLTGGGSVDLLYGLPAVPAFTYTPEIPGDPPTPPTGSWSVVSNTMGQTPVWGLPGFGNVFNNYIWSMQEHGGRLWVGTMDWSFVLWELWHTAVVELEIPLPDPETALGEFLACLHSGEDIATPFGGDLYYFPASDRPAFPESIGGVGNIVNYGVRSMASAPTGLYVGTANPMNLLTDTTDDLPEGGWEVLRLVDRPVNTPTGSDVAVTLPDGSTVTLCGVEEEGYTVGTWVPTPCCGAWLPVPPNYQQPRRMLLVGSSALLSEENGCSATGPVTVCVPNPGAGATRLLQPVAVGGSMTWEDITAYSYGPLVCGTLVEGSQALIQGLGYHGYLGAVVELQQNEAIPALSGWGVAALVALLAAAGAAALRSRLG